MSAQRFILLRSSCVTVRDAVTVAPSSSFRYIFSVWGKQHNNFTGSSMTPFDKVPVEGCKMTRFQLQIRASTYWYCRTWRRFILSRNTITTGITTATPLSWLMVNSSGLSNKSFARDLKPMNAVTPDSSLGLLRRLQTHQAYHLLLHRSDSKVTKWNTNHNTNQSDAVVQCGPARVSR